MAAGRPIVAYDVGGAAEAVVDGESGYLVDPGDFPRAARRVNRPPEGARPIEGPGRSRQKKGPWSSMPDLMVRRQEDLYRAAPVAGRGGG